MDLNRRDFTRLSMAAFGGVLAGCSGAEKPAQAPQAASDKPAPQGDAVAVASDIHACRGLNSCKGLGKGGDNACAGLGNCFTAKAHDCGTLNDCKHQGGCGEKPAYNDCKGMGGCGLPIHEGAWEKAREIFEKQMQTSGKEFGKAPEPKET